MPARPVPEKFLVAFSLAGEQRELVRSIAEAVEQLLGRGSVFFDEWFEHYIAGADADTRLQEIYGQQAELVVVSVSASYGGKPWTLAEHEAIRARHLQLRGSEDRKDAFRILPLRTGAGDVKGILFNTICPDVRQKPVAQTAELIVNRLRLIVPEAKPAPETPSRFIYLAECTPDLEDPRDRMKAFLEELGWTVRPAEEYPENQYQSALEQDLKGSLASVQLLGPYPWKRGGFDRIQNDAATALGIPRFRHRSAEIDLAKVDAQHREFLTAPEVIASGFEDFKAHLEKELAVLAQRRDTAAHQDDDDGHPPLVAVAIHSANPEPLWEQVFQWIYEQEKIDPYQLGPGETFESKHRAEPCHGFLVVCDVASLEEGPHSPRPDMEQCRLIQMKEKNAARRPPVGLVYWPPPAVAWSRLLRCTPLKLHRILGDAPANLGQFFDEVRKVAQ
ncbi:MAG: hypothetical protein QOE70_3788 [Chthoniobacter sp.]|jgi:hypothetical protein|nr:hypothetical protein [Chthoniobacter sp.]